MVPESLNSELIELATDFYIIYLYMILVVQVCKLRSHRVLRASTQIPKEGLDQGSWVVLGTQQTNFWEG